MRPRRWPARRAVAPRRRRGDAQAAADLTARLHDLSPWYEAEARIVLARTHLQLDDVAGARAWLAEAGRYLKRTPDADGPSRVAGGGLEAGRCGQVRDRPLAAQPGRVEAASIPSDPPHLPGDRRGAVRLAEHGQDPGAVDLREARRLVAQRGRGVRPDGRPGRAERRQARSVAGSRSERRQITRLGG